MNNSKSQDNRRKSLRLFHNVPLKISTGDVDIVTETLNLSAAGAYCKVDKFIEPMTKLSIHLLLPIKKAGKVQTAKVSCCGVVVRVEPIPGKDDFYVAIFFNDIQPKEIRLIDEFVSQMLDEEDDV